MGTQGRAECERYDAEKAEKVKSRQQLYAKIKRSSKYFERGALFEVRRSRRNPAAYLKTAGAGRPWRAVPAERWTEPVCGR